MKFRYEIAYREQNSVRPYYVYDIKEQRCVGTFSTFEKAKAKYPKSFDCTKSIWEDK